MILIIKLNQKYRKKSQENLDKQIFTREKRYQLELKIGEWYVRVKRYELLQQQQQNNEWKWVFRHGPSEEENYKRKYWEDE